MSSMMARSVRFFSTSSFGATSLFKSQLIFLGATARMSVCDDIGGDNETGRKAGTTRRNHRRRDIGILRSFNDWLNLAVHPLIHF